MAQTLKQFLDSRDAAVPLSCHIGYDIASDTYLAVIPALYEGKSLALPVINGCGELICGELR